MKKKNIWIIILCLALTTYRAYSQNLFAVRNAFGKQNQCQEEGSACGYKTAENELKIPMRFCNCRHFINGIAAVKNENKWGLIDGKGQTVLAFEYDKLEHFLNQFYAGVKTINGTDSSYIIDQGGRIVYAGVFGQPTFYRPLNRILLQPEVNHEHKKIAQYKVAIFDSNFNELITYYSANELHADFINIQNPGKPSHDNTYFVLTEHQEEDKKLNSLSAIYKKTGQKIFDSVLVRNNILLKNPGKEQQAAAIIDSNLQFIIPFEEGYRDIRKFNHLPVYSYRKDQNWGVMDQHFKKILPDKFQDFIYENKSHIEGIVSGNGGLTYQRYTENGTFIDSGFSKEVLPLPLSKFIITKAANGKFKVIDNTGVPLLKADYDEIKMLGDFFVLGQRQGLHMKYGIADATGKTLTKIWYDDIVFIPGIEGSGHFIMSSKNKSIPDIIVVP